MFARPGLRHACLAVALSPLLLAACAGSSPEQDASTTDAAATPATASAARTAAPDATAAVSVIPLTGYHWRLTDARRGSDSRIDALFVRGDRPITLEFDGSRVSVANTCNRMVGGYTASAGTLQIARFASTLMACPDPALSNLDRAVADALGGKHAMTIDAGGSPTLVLKGEGGRTLTFVGEATPENRYASEGTTLFLEVAPEKVPCNHPMMPNATCLSVRDVTYDEDGVRTGAPSGWRVMHAQIEGFGFTQGQRTVLRVKRFDVPNAPADASRYAYVLDMVVETSLATP